MNLTTVTALSASETARTDSNSSSSSQDSNASQPNSFTALFSSHLNEEQNRTQQNASNAASQNTQNNETQPQPMKHPTTQSSPNTTTKTENTSAKQADGSEDAQSAEAEVGDELATTESTVQSSLSALLKQSHATHGKSTSANADASTTAKTDAADKSDDAALTLGEQVTADTDISVVTTDQDASSTIMAMLGAGLAPQLQKVTAQPITSQSEGVAALSVDGQNALQTLTDDQQSTSLTSMLNAVADDATTGQDDDAALTDILGRASGKTASKGNGKDDSTDLKNIVVDTTATSNKVQSSDITAAVSNAFKVTQEPSSANNSNSSAATVNSALGALNSTQANTTAAATPQTAVLTSRLGSDEWQQALSQQVVMFTRNNQQNVELRLHPQELGAIQVSMKMDDNQAQIHLASAHGQVRAALEAAMPQLRTALSESGITLNQSSVGSETFGGSEWQQGQQQSAGGGSSSSQYSSSLDNHMDIVDVPASLQRIASSSSGVDTFA
ncbi:flagellar hook-length control protein FliK [Lonsdalea quercina]|uniref:flagellar hook-length control protein FliK n=1 Tax=Lonsdalea quercina TaxID=71657 RepID=UPI0039750DC5